MIEIDAPALLGGDRDAVTRLWTLRRAAMRARLAELGATTATWDGARPLEVGARGGDGIPARIAARRARLALALAALVVAAAVALSALLSAATGAGVVLTAAGLALLAVRHPAALAGALAALAVAIAVALDQGAAPAAAPLWGAGLLRRARWPSAA